MQYDYHTVEALNEELQWLKKLSRNFQVPTPVISKKGMKDLLDSWLKLSTATDPKEIHYILETFGSVTELESHLRKFIHSQAGNLKPQILH